MERRALILAGGCGRRLWPYSSKELPKQFIPLEGGASPFRQAWERAAAVVGPEGIWTVVRPDHVDVALRQAPELLRGRVVVEPVTRGTAAAVAFVVHAMAREVGEGVIWVLPSDHSIPRPRPLLDAVDGAMAAAAGFPGVILVGIPPTRPETQYGYIQPGGPWDGGPLEVVERFHEKPSPQEAARYLRSGCYWNSGMAIFSLSALEGALERHAPGVWDLVRRMGPSAPLDRLVRLYRLLPATSLDHLLLERMEELLVARVEMEWEDLGLWQSHYQRGRRDRRGNVVKGRVFQRGCSHSLLVAGRERIVGAIGLDGMAVIAHGRGVLVAPRERLAEVGELVAEMEAQGISGLEWGVSPGLTPKVGGGDGADPS